MSDSKVWHYLLLATFLHGIEIILNYILILYFQCYQQQAIRKFTSGKLMLSDLMLFLVDCPLTFSFTLHKFLRIANENFLRFFYNFSLKKLQKEGKSE